jgi:hypothetical protein
MKLEPIIPSQANNIVQAHRISASMSLFVPAKRRATFL